MIQPGKWKGFGQVSPPCPARTTPTDVVFLWVQAANFAKKMCWEVGIEVLEADLASFDSSEGRLCVFEREISHTRAHTHIYIICIKDPRKKYVYLYSIHAYTHLIRQCDMTYIM